MICFKSLSIRDGRSQKTEHCKELLPVEEVSLRGSSGSRVIIDGKMMLVLTRWVNLQFMGHFAKYRELIVTPNWGNKVGLVGLYHNV